MIIWTALYALAFLIGLFTKRFRSDYIAWLNLEDPLGSRFWGNNLWFLGVTALYFFALFVLFAFASGSESPSF